MRFKDLTGQVFGRLTALKPVGKNKFGKVTWLCICECGQYKVVCGTNLTQSYTRSCGCLEHENKSERARERNKKKNPCKIKHHLSGTRIYSIWRSMLNRCFNKKNANFHSYGGRGITVCEEWLDVETFKMWADISGYSEKLTLERIDVNGNYCPENCTWIPESEQAKNKRPKSEWLPKLKLTEEEQRKKFSITDIIKP